MGRRVGTRVNELMISRDIRREQIDVAEPGGSGPIFDEATTFYAASNGPKCWLTLWNVDVASGLDGCKGVTPWQKLRDLVMELEFHEEGLSDRSSLIVANNMDENGVDD
ncbi:hypothetical protein DY000_02032953 [Brassica cretica]|uniref:Uncharacterized protein n=1 Tax=Brassica cretica TaxID=69181 RepID=A0ABQ7DP17_BRACR|nr:hypothetical protein DY000_02032953 [Brassica cretica]